MWKRLIFVLSGLALFAGGLLALQAPNVTGQAVGTNPRNPAEPDRYEITITLHPGDPRIHDMHFYWANAPGNPSQPNWSGPDGSWTANVSDNQPAPDGTPGVSGGTDSVSFTSQVGMAAGAGPTTFTFTFKPYGGGGQQPPPRTVYWYATTDGTFGLPGGGFGDDDVEGWGMVNQAGGWNFPTW